MASIISAGTTSGTSLNLSGDTSGVLQLATNGSTTAITVDTSQNVGIGTSSPTGKLSVAGIVKSTALSTIGNDGVWMDFSAPNGRIAAINSSGAPASNLLLATTTTGGSTQTVLQCSFDGTAKVLTTLGVGNAAGSTSGAGITFPATQSASSDANTLDDYEEGTWTPTFVSTGATFTHVVQAGRYTKIGNLVNASCYLGASVSGTTSNGVVVSGLPFTVSNTANYYPAATIGQIWQLDYPAGAIQLVSFSDPNTTNMILVFSTDNSTTTNVLASYFRTAGSQTFLMLNITYQV